MPDDQHDDQHDHQRVDEQGEQPARLHLAGMALRNGVLMLGPTSWAAVVRTRSGELHQAGGRRPTVGEHVSEQVPLLRGPVRLLNMLLVLPRLRKSLPAARLSMESAEVLGATVASSLLLRSARRGLGAGIAADAVGTVGSLATTLATMRSGEIAAYHGAEHKAIAGYEQGITARAANREHPRCGTQLAVPALLFSVIATRVLLMTLPKQARGSAPLAGQLLGIAAATELFRAAQRGKGGAPARLTQRMGIGLQRHATTVEPNDDQLAVAELALQRVLDAEARAAG
jgi:uncharacterized protein YqhQ